MLGRLILIFVTVPLIELAILIQLGQWLGLWPTIGLVVVTGAIGAALARSQGLRVLARIRADLAAGRMPVDDLVNGLMILCAGALLLTPGLLSDLFGLAVLLPGTRNRLKRAVAGRFTRMVETSRVNVTVYQNPFS